MDRGRDEHSLAERAGHLKHRVLERGGVFGVVEIVLAPARRDGEALPRDHVVYLVSEKPRRVHDRPREETLPRDLNVETAVRANDALNTVIEQEPHAVAARVLGRCEGEAVGIDDAARRRHERAGNLGRDVRLHLARPIPRHDAHALNPVRIGAADKLLELQTALVVESEHHRPVATKLHAKLVAPARIRLRALDVEARLERAGRGVEARMHNSGVRSGRTAGNVVSRLEYTDGQVIARKLAGRRAPGNASSDDHHIEGTSLPFLHMRTYPFLFVPRPRCPSPGVSLRLPLPVCE